MRTKLCSIRGARLLPGFGLGLCLLVTTVAYADCASERNHELNLSPTMLDGDGSEKIVLGLDFALAGSLVKCDLSTGGTGLSTGALDSTDSGNLELDYSISGVVAADDDNNPKDFLKASLTGNYVFETRAVFQKFGLFTNYETDQGFDDKQLAYGIGYTVVFGRDADYRGDWASRSSAALELNWGNVDPSKDENRAAILGKSLSTYDRIGLEIYYHYNIGTRSLDTFELDYRYFKEESAPQAIRDAGLNEYELWTARLRFLDRFYIAYSDGNLPFDKTSERIFEAGISYDFGGE